MEGWSLFGFIFIKSNCFSIYLLFSPSAPCFFFRGGGGDLQDREGERKKKNKDDCMVFSNLMCRDKLLKGGGQFSSLISWAK